MTQRQIKLVENYIQRQIKSELAKSTSAKKNRLNEISSVDEFIFKNKFLKLYEEYMNYMNEKYGKSKNYSKFEAAFKNFMNVTNLGKVTI